MINEQELKTDRGGILYDAPALSKCGLAPAHELFAAEAWQSRGGVEVLRGGRGNVAFVRAGEERWVLRHYRRGGFVARVNDDCYLWSRADATRSYREWRLLAQLRAWELPVPAPVAAQYVRTGMWYRADLFTRAIEDSRTLAETMVEGSADANAIWQALGTTIARFHARGVHHADLNAHNILVDAQGQIHVLDFDRGRIEARGRWEQRVLERLHRSLRKVSLQQQTLFEEPHWEAMMTSYDSELQRRV